jgi:hypothetical protein
MRTLADHRRLVAKDVSRATDAARSLLESWREEGWLHAVAPAP